jgi:hypothetical protein
VFWEKIYSPTDAAKIRLKDTVNKSPTDNKHAINRHTCCEVKKFYMQHYSLTRTFGVSNYTCSSFLLIVVNMFASGKWSWNGSFLVANICLLRLFLLELTNIYMWYTNIEMLFCVLRCFPMLSYCTILVSVIW